MQIECGQNDIQVYFDHALNPRPHSPIAIINAIEMVEEGLANHSCHQAGKADLLAALGQLLILDQQIGRAKKSLEAAAMIYVDCGQLSCLLNVRLGLADVALTEANPEQAFDLVTDVLADIESDPNHGHARQLALVILARIHVAQKNYDHARQVIGAAIESSTPDQLPELQNILGTISVLEEFGPVTAPAPKQSEGQPGIKPTIH